MQIRRMWDFTLLLKYFLFLVAMSAYCRATRQLQEDSGPEEVNHSSQNLIGNATQQMYSPWTEWSKCSRECDVGISTRTRKCLKRTYNSKGVLVPTCRGESIEHKLCKLKNCSTGSPDFRSTQCTEYNNRIIGGKLVKLWKPAKVGPNPCELRCVASASDEEGFEYSFGKVADGTPCSLGVCLDGRCLRAGCDEHVGSEVTPDMCGVCGGLNATCVHYKDLYLGQPSPSDDGLKSNYHEVVVIPTGARHLFIRQTIGKNYLALQDRTTGVIFHGEQYLSSLRGSYAIAGTSVDFIKLDNATEALVAKEPITQELYVLALLRNRNPGIYYEYWLPTETNNPGRFYLARKANDKSQVTIPPSQRFQSPTNPVWKPRTTPPTRHHPTKPHFAYPYGEKPYKAEDVPIFRHKPTSTTTSSPNVRRHYDVNGKRWYYPDAAVSDQPVVKKGQKETSDEDDLDLKKDLRPAYRKRYLTRKPVFGYYQTFRNHSAVEKKSAKVLKDKEVPDLTQGDASSVFNGRYGNSLSNVVFDYGVKDKKIADKVDDAKSFDGKFKAEYKPNPKWKYTVDGNGKDDRHAQVDSPDSGLQLVTPLTIAVLPLSETGNVTTTKKEKKKYDRKQKSRLTRGGLCEPCQRVRNQAKNFCKSDFVIRASVVGIEFLHGETRYELEVKQSFKNNLSLLPREYVWAPDTCRCPKMRIGKEYVIMGRSDSTYRRNESRLLVDKTCFVRVFNLKYARRLQKLRKDQARKCKDS